jgi:hypothetical protein
MVKHTRRELLGLGASVALAGCLGPIRGNVAQTGADADASPEAVPTASGTRHLAHDPAHLREEVVSGGVHKDGIPSIDDPSFVAADEATALADGDVVFGVARDGTVKAYPQSILVHHEIVNDRVAGRPVSVTYCPLTGTAMGFDRGDTTFGVSGTLVNNNLVMYDRATDGRWPQLLATAIEGPHEGASLREFDVVWTTWKRWRSTHPDTRVLSRDTGYIRSYDTDPYGSYGPKRGYYAEDSTMFPRLAVDDRLGAKDVVVGVRTGGGAVAVEADRLRETGLLDTTVDGKRVVLVHDPDLDAGYGYRPPAGPAIETGDGGVVVDGESFAPDALPFDRVPAIDAMWFAWSGFYPDTALHRHERA